MIKYRDLISHHYRDESMIVSLKFCQISDYIDDLKHLIAITKNTKLKRGLKTELCKAKRELKTILKYYE